MAKRRKKKNEPKNKNEKWIEINNFIFGSGYFSEYRYLRMHQLLIDRKLVDKSFKEFRDEQKDSIQIMIDIEILINAIQYCSDLASVLVCIQKDKGHLMKTLSSIHEKGSGSIHEFYEKLITRDISYFWKLCGYNLIDIPDKDKAKYLESARRFKQDLIVISNYFSGNWQFYVGYKHGLRLSGLRNIPDNRIILKLACFDNTFTMALLSEDWIIDAINVTEVTHKMFKNIVTPQLYDIPMKKRLGSQVGKKKIEHKEEAGLTKKDGESRFKIQYELPWRIYTGKFNEPFY